MTAQRKPDVWDDERLDRALLDALAVEPSPGMHARVRARVSTEAVSPPRLDIRWGLAACAAVATMVLGGTVGSRLWNEPASHPQPSTLTAIPIAASTAPYPAAVAPAPHAVPPAAGEAAQVAQVAPIIVAKFALEDREAFRQFLALSRAGLLPQPTVLPVVSDEGAVVLTEIEFSTIEIPWLVVSSAGGGESPW